MPTQASVSSSTDQGSLAPLGIGLALIALSTVLVTLAAGSVYLTERRLTGVAESTALAVLYDAQEDLNQPLIPLANSHLNAITLPGLNRVVLIEASADDNKTVRVRLCSTWLPIFQSYMFSETGRVCSEGLARRGK